LSKISNPDFGGESLVYESIVVSLFWPRVQASSHQCFVLEVDDRANSERHDSLRSSNATS
jgi:hypothetical protein